MEKDIKKIFVKAKTAAGFTLIELLVVIGILGILASALVATIDPFEQLKKANDSNVKNVAVEFLNANIRYYTTHNAMPWEASGDDNCNGTTAGASGDGWVTAEWPVAQLLTSANLDDCLDALIAEKELKSGFKDVEDVLKNVYVTYDEDDIVTQVCFKPTAISGQNDEAAKYKADAEPPTTFAVDTSAPDTVAACISNGGETQCYWCTQ